MPRPINYNKKKREAIFGKRRDGTKKGEGYFGVLKRPDGKISTELSMGVSFDRQERDIPSLVPGLLESQKRHLLNGGKLTPDIVKRGIRHARKRLRKGKSPYAGPEDYGKTYPQHYKIPKRKK